MQKRAHTHTHTHTSKGGKQAYDASSVGPQKMLWPPGLKRGSTRGCAY